MNPGQITAMAEKSGNNLDIEKTVKYIKMEHTMSEFKEKMRKKKRSFSCFFFLTPSNRSESQNPKMGQ